MKKGDLSPRNKDNAQSVYDGKGNIVCPKCKSNTGLYNKYGELNSYCGVCGQKLLWAFGKQGGNL